MGDIGRTAQELPGSNDIAELCHGNASKRKRLRVVAQGDPLQRGEGITCGQGMGRGCDQ